MGETAIFLICAFCFGLLLGSFLNVCIARLPDGDSIVSPRSRCLYCAHPIAARDNIPLLSYALLRGRCRHCSQPIGWQYPATEFATGLWFALCALQPSRALIAAIQAGGYIPDAVLQGAVHQASMAALGFLLIGLAAMDWRTRLLPDEFTLGGIFVGLVFAGTESFFLPPPTRDAALTPAEDFIFTRMLTAFAAFLVLYLIGWIYRKVRGRVGMGAGDTKMLAMMGAFLGPALTVVAFFVAILTAAMYGIALLVTRRANGRTRIPFGSFLALGGLVSAAAGTSLVGWYLGLFPRW